MTTPAPDAPRLVPVCHEIALSNHMKVTLEYDPDGSCTAVLWNEANEPIADGDAPVLSASPAVQPAAGREEIARVEGYLRRLAKSRQHDQEFIHSFDVGEPSEACLLVSDLRAILAALAHPPAQGSESGGEDVEVVHWIREASREITGGNCAFVDDDLAILTHLAKRAIDAGLTDGLSPQVQAALSAPQAAPGEGEQS